MMRHFILLAALLGGMLLHAADTPINLLQTGKFEPVIMHGKPSAARGWYLFAHAPLRSGGPGRRCRSF